jgi:hypothetical protein
MKTSLELLRGSISRDYVELIESDVVMDAAAKKKPKTPLDTESGKNCTGVPKVCKAKLDTESGKNCSGLRICKPKKKSQAFLPVAGWSTPPAPPQF